MSNIPTGTTLNGHSITYWNRQTEADGDVMSTDTIMPICSAINDNIKAIETMQAATDVIDVFGSYSAFEENSGTLTAEGYLTDKDIIKVLEDESYSSMQVYYQYTSADNSWSAIGSLDPYYSKSDIDTITANIETEISTNYLKADNINEGNNITITKTTMTDGPTITIGTKDVVSFDTVSSTGFSGTNISGGSKTATIDNLITSAEGGSAANSWLTTNINNYISAIGSADMKNITGEISTGTNGSAKTATIKLSGYKPAASGNLMATTGEDLTVTLNTNDNVVFDSITATSIDSNSIFVTGISSTNLTSQNISALNLTGNYTSAIDFSAFNGVFSNRYIRTNASTGLVTNHEVFGSGPIFDAADVGEIYTLYVTNTSLNPVIGTGDPYSAFVVSYPIGNGEYSYVGIKCGKGVQLMKIGGSGPGGQSYYTCLNPNLGFKKPASGLPDTSSEGWGNLYYKEDEGTVYC